MEPNHQDMDGQEEASGAPNAFYSVSESIVKEIDKFRSEILMLYPTIGSGSGGNEDFNTIFNIQVERMTIKIRALIERELPRSLETDSDAASVIAKKAICLLRIQAAMAQIDERLSKLTEDRNKK